MEHNHNPLIYGFLVSFLVFGIGLALAWFSMSGSDFQSIITLQVFGVLMIVAGIIMLRGTFKKRDQCEVCKDKYKYRRKN